MGLLLSSAVECNFCTRNEPAFVAGIVDFDLPKDSGTAIEMLVLHQADLNQLKPFLVFESCG
jgi:hypothetical protein